MLLNFDKNVVQQLHGVPVVQVGPEFWHIRLSHQLINLLEGIDCPVKAELYPEELLQVLHCIGRNELNEV